MNQILDTGKIEELKTLIQKGVIYEDEFIVMYMQMIRDEGFLAYFPEAGQERAKSLINILIEESRRHKQTLEKIISELK